MFSRRTRWPAGRPAGHRVVPGEATSVRVLTLDDEPGIGRLIRRVAGGLGMACEATTTVAEFRARFQAAPPDAVALDLHLGEGEDGVEQLRFLSAERYAGPILLLSGLDQRLLEAARRVGQGFGLTVAAALAKPVRVEALRASLEGLRSLAVWTPSAAELRQAIEAGELSLHLQPIVEARSRRPIRAEALARWTHPGRGPMPPDRFIPVAEADPELADALTLWAIGEAARCQRELAARGFDLPIAVNVSALNLRDLRFPDRVHETARRAGMAPSRLVLELTETAAFADPLRATDILLRLRIKGFELALDDFGTGYSSLKALQRMPFSALKIDRPFVADLITSRDSAAIVAAIVDLARHMELRTVAEGVETEAVAGALAGLGVGALQGHHIGRPMPAEALTARLSA
jgi:EAL domain-containing protein (putative c-di-GMP-specific phosphodiesterase class I)/ActR/RegA family two-component response regulator